MINIVSPQDVLRAFTTRLGELGVKVTGKYDRSVSQFVLNRRIIELVVVFSVLRTSSGFRLSVDWVVCIQYIELWAIGAILNIFQLDDIYLTVTAILFDWFLLAFNEREF